MTTPLRVLILEDQPEDAEIMISELRQAGFEPDWRRVETDADYVAQLRSVPDVILADHTLPRFGAPEALELLKGQALDIPFIVVTGNINEEVAVERMKQGAADYILKDRMTRLGVAVRRALQEKKLRDEKRQAEMQVRLNLERIRALHEIDLTITSTLDLHNVLALLLEKSDVFFPYAATTVELFDGESGLLEPAACRNLDEKEWRAEKWRAGRGLANMAFGTRTAVVVDNIQKDAGSADAEFYRNHGWISYLGVPLIAKGKVLGTLSFYTKEEHSFTGEEIEFLSTLAGQAATAVQNSQLYEGAKKQAEELARSNVQLQRSNKVKDEFLSVMSHELRTPLNIVVGYAAMIQEGILGDVNPKQEGAVRKILSKANEQLAMVNSVLYATSLEAGAVKAAIEEVHIGQFIKAIAHSIDVPPGKQIALRWDCPAELPVTRTDAGKLKLILEHLVTNAIKFTDKGAVTVSVRHRPESRVLEFVVADTGIGIPEQELPTIFEKFHQVDSTDTRLYGGVGLGLYIVKRFAELLGGRVEVKSEIGKGSTFRLTMPCEP